MEDFVSSALSLEALSALLSPQQEEEVESKKVTAFAQLGPGHIGPPPTKGKDETTAYVQRNCRDIWSDEEVTDGSQFEDLTDLRPQPEYEIILKQSVGTEDLFLGLSRKDPSSMCCEAMLVKIKLPDTKATDVVLDVKEKFLDLRTPKHKLGLHLPNAVHNQEGRARFFSEREELEVTLFLRQPMNFINMQ